MNLIKIISHTSWKLSQKTLISVYRSLIGSVLDYKFFISTSISKTNENNLQIIQNKAVRCIYKLYYDKIRNTTVEILNNRSGLGSVSDRFEKLKLDYINQAQLNQNPLISQLISEYYRFRSAIDKEGLKKTFLSGVFT